MFEAILGLVILAVVLFFFGGLVKMLVNSIQSSGEQVLRVGEANTQVWAKEQRKSIAKRASKVDDAPSWDDLDKLLNETKEETGAKA